MKDRQAKSFVIRHFLTLFIASSLFISGCASQSVGTQLSALSGEESTADTTEPTNSPDSPQTEEEKEEEEEKLSWISAVFIGDPILNVRKSVLEDVQSSGFNTLILGLAHVHSDGDLYLNGNLVCQNGEVVLSEKQKKSLSSIKGEGSSVKRVEIAIGGWGCTDFESIRDLIKSDGTGEDTILYRNFKALIDLVQADAINYDDESCYDVSSAVSFGKMVANMGASVTLCPYTNMNFWVSVAKRLKDKVEYVYLQCYAGGSSNYYDIQSWYNAMGQKIIVGVGGPGGGDYSQTSTKVLSSYLKKNADLVGGAFIWLYDDMMNYSSPDSPKDYAEAINSAAPVSTD
jgi:hypothetical protein